MFPVAHAQEQTGGSLFFQILPLLAIVALFYFMLIRPQQKKTRQHREMLNSLQTGNEVITSGGMLGKVSKIHESFVTLDVSGQKITFQKQSIQTMLPKGTIEGI